ncbi:hypothetical protein [Azonexus sp. IMCC34839]|uniref:hypothetical protein n=1 Tax=Azonexus sp. IMCC34839 TaxID=3133695 RepID=UPI003999DF37
MEIFKMIGRLILFLIGLYFLGAGLFCGAATLFSPLWFFSLIGFGCAWVGFYLIKQAIKKEASEVFDKNVEAKAPAKSASSTNDKEGSQ